jgi:hypothetical protein
MIVAVSSSWIGRRAARFPGVERVDSCLERIRPGPVGVACQQRDPVRGAVGHPVIGLQHGHHF